MLGVTMHEPSLINTMMDSREIASITGKRHADVCRDIRNMLTALKIDQRRFASVYLAGNGEERPCFLLPKLETLTLISGYDTVLRHKVVTRWAELEAAQVPAVKTTPVPTARMSRKEILLLALEQEEQIEAQAAHIDVLEDYVEAASSYIEEVAVPAVEQNARINTATDHDIESKALARRLGWKYNDMRTAMKDMKILVRRLPFEPTGAYEHQFTKLTREQGVTWYLKASAYTWLEKRLHGYKSNTGPRSQCRTIAQGWGDCVETSTGEAN